MAIEKQALTDTYSKGAAPRMMFRDTHPRTFAQAGAVKELAVGTAVSRSSSTTHWQEWVPAGGNDTGRIRGFVAEKFSVSDTGETIGVVALAGQIHADDIIHNGTPTELLTELELVSETMRSRGFDVVGRVNLP